LLALAHCTLGEVENAVEIFQQWLEDDPDDPVARHLLAACSGRDIPPRASDAFIEKTFDSFAASFDSKLAKLSYRAPALVTEMLKRSGVAPSKSLDVLDAGCGTGLCGALIAPYAHRLVGVDLSGRMLAHARHRNVYDELIKCELTAYLADCNETFDVIVSADTLVYFGTLDSVIAASHRALRPGGRLIFTVEELVDAEHDAGYSLGTSGRYRHAREHIQALLRETKLRPEIVSAELRLEAGEPVAGLVVQGTKQAPDAEPPARMTGVSEHDINLHVSSSNHTGRTTASSRSTYRATKLREPS
jgi:predicted TPR repeat methyltransferase